MPPTLRSRRRSLPLNGQARAIQGNELKRRRSNDIANSDKDEEAEWTDEDKK